ncbi:hypothetical protein J6590_017706 [Homalodisca vitripennis]|nr:hypothetical protein J6590_017706 [Homalodisca vitripennis]
MDVRKCAHVLQDCSTAGAKFTAMKYYRDNGKRRVQEWRVTFSVIPRESEKVVYARECWLFTSHQFSTRILMEHVYDIVCCPLCTY